MNIDEALLQYQSLEDSDSPRFDAELLLCHVLDKSRAYLMAHGEEKLTKAHKSQFIELLDRRRRGEPVAYILGHQPFWSLDLLVNPSTLIPRPDTEKLVEVALGLFGQQPRRVLDLGTGTGAIALALASERPQWQLIGADKQFDAVQLAKANGRRLGFQNVSFLCSDWFQEVGSQRPRHHDSSPTDENKFDLIVCNPPYIDPLDPHLDQGDVRFEPRSALVSDISGTADLQYLIDQAKHYLLNGGYLLLEHGYQQGEWVNRAMRQAGYYDVQTHNDLAGNPRVTGGRKD